MAIMRVDNHSVISHYNRSNKFELFRSLLPDTKTFDNFMCVDSHSATFFGSIMRLLANTQTFNNHMRIDKHTNIVVSNVQSRF